MFRLLIVGGPLGLAAVILVSLWASQLHLQRSIVLQVHQQWQPGEHLAARAQLLDHDQRSIEGATAHLRLQYSDETAVLGDLEVVPGNGVYQGHFQVPADFSGTGELELRFDETGREPTVERVRIESVSQREPITSRHTVATSTLQWADDTDPQTEPWHIDLSPSGRMLAAFDNEFLVRITDDHGVPVATRVRVALVSGEFADVIGRDQDAPTVFEGPTDALGLARFRGHLASEVVRFEVHVDLPADKTESTPESSSPADQTQRPTRHRRFRFVSYAGGVEMSVDVRAIAPSDELTVRTQSLRRGRRVHIDVHGPDGTWIATAAPDAANERDTTWQFTVPPTTSPGVLQLEAYPYTNAPGESSAIARVQVLPVDKTDAGLSALVQHYRDHLDVPRVDKHFDADHERAWLDWLVAHANAQDIDSARGWLLGTLPVELYGPPLALSTRDRELEAIAARRAWWTMLLRWVLLGGGAAFIAIAGYAVSRAHAQTTLAIDTELAAAGWSDEAIAEHRQSQRSLLMRGLLLIGIIAASLVLALILLENLVWVH